MASIKMTCADINETIRQEILFILRIYRELIPIEFDLLLRKSNPYHVPAGSAEGGQFDHAPGGSSGSSGQSMPRTHAIDRQQPRPNGDSDQDSTRTRTQKIKSATEHLVWYKKPKAPQRGQGECAKYVRRALVAGGIKITQPAPPPGETTPLAKDYGTSLEKAGFKPVAKSTKPAIYPGDYKAQLGDVVVIQSTSTSRAGHMAMYAGDETGWISDFHQSGFWPGPVYSKEKPDYTVYRLEE